MINYFSSCTTKEEATKEYKRLAKIHHPDSKTGSEITMRHINQQYDDFKLQKPFKNEPHKTCPFCGKASFLIIRSTTAALCKVKCKHCGATGPETYTGQGRDSFAKWNMRN